MNAIRIAIIVSFGFVLSVANSASCFAQWAEVKANDKIRFEYQGRKYDGQVTKISQIVVQIKYVDKNRKERDLPFPISSIKLITHNGKEVEQTSSPNQGSSNDVDPFKEENSAASGTKNSSGSGSKNPFEPETSAKSKSPNSSGSGSKNPFEPESSSKSKSPSNLTVGKSVQFKYESHEYEGIVLQVAGSTVKILYKDEAGTEWNQLFQLSDIEILATSDESKRKKDPFRDENESGNSFSAKPLATPKPESSSKTKSASSLTVGNSIQFKYEGQEYEGVVMQMSDFTITIKYLDENRTEWNWPFQKSDIVILNSDAGRKGSPVIDQNRSRNGIAANSKSDSDSKTSSPGSNPSITSAPNSSAPASGRSTARTMTPAEIQEFREKMIPPEFGAPSSRMWIPRFRLDLKQVGTGLGVLIVSIVLVAVGINNVKTRVAEESGGRRFVNTIMGSSNTYTGGKAVLMGWVRIIGGGIFGLVGMGMIFFGIF